MKIEERIKKLSSCQKKALKELLGKDNIFLSGSAGSGKTTLINLYIDILEQREVEYFITASTGRASILVNGITFHSFFGLGIMQEEEDKLINKAINTPKVRNRIEKAEIILECIKNKTYKWTITVDEYNNLEECSLLRMISGLFYKTPNFILTPEYAKVFNKILVWECISIAGDSIMQLNPIVFDIVE